MNVFAHHRATTSFPDWVIRDCHNFGQNFKKMPIVASREIVYTNLEEFKNYENSKILIIGGGPSTKEIVYNLSDYDYIWSCNHFFKNPKLKNQKIDLAIIMPEVDLKSDEFLEYRRKHNPLLGFEIHDSWMNYRFDDYERYFLMHTRFYSKIGIGARMLIFSAAIKCKQVDFVGFDGPSYQLKGNHAFQPGKKNLPSIFVGKSERQIVDFHIMQYETLWNFIGLKFPNTRFTNIGYGNEYHKFINFKRRKNEL